MSSYGAGSEAALTSFSAGGSRGGGLGVATSSRRLQRLGSSSLGPSGKHGASSFARGGVSRSSHHLPPGVPLATTKGSTSSIGGPHQSNPANVKLIGQCRADLQQLQRCLEAVQRKSGNASTKAGSYLGSMRERSRGTSSIETLLAEAQDATAVAAQEGFATAEQALSAKHLKLLLLQEVLRKVTELDCAILDAVNDATIDAVGSSSVDAGGSILAGGGGPAAAASGKGPGRAGAESTPVKQVLTSMQVPSASKAGANLQDISALPLHVSMACRVVDELVVPASRSRSGSRSSSPSTSTCPRNSQQDNALSLSGAGMGTGTGVGAANDSSAAECRRLTATLEEQKKAHEKEMDALRRSMQERVEGLESSRAQLEGALQSERAAAAEARERLSMVERDLAASRQRQEDSASVAADAAAAEERNSALSDALGLLDRQRSQRAAQADALDRATQLLHQVVAKLFASTEGGATCPPSETGATGQERAVAPTTAVADLRTVVEASTCAGGSGGGGGGGGGNKETEADPLGALDAAGAAMDVSMLRLADCGDLLASASTRVDALVRSRGKLEAAADETARLTSEVKGLSASRDALQNRFDEQATELAELRQRQQSSSSEAEMAVRALQNEQQSVMAELASLQSELDDARAELQREQGDNTRLRADLDALQKYNATLQERLRSLGNGASAREFADTFEEVMREEMMCMKHGFETKLLTARDEIDALQRANSQTLFQLRQQQRFQRTNDISATPDGSNGGNMMMRASSSTNLFCSSEGRP